MLSVVIPTRNRARLLGEALRSIGRQLLPMDEVQVVVVDNASTDETETVARLAARSGLQLTYAREDVPGLHAARHRGIREAAHDLIVFGDDDIVAEPTWLAGVAEAFSDAGVGLVGGPCRPLYEVDPPAWVEQLRMPAGEGWMIPEWSVGDLGREASSVRPELVWGCNFAVRRAALEAVDGFHPDGFPQEHLRWRGDGETYVARAVSGLGWDVRYHPGAAVGHRVSAARLSERYLLRRGFRDGVGGSYADFRRDQVMHSAATSLRYRLSSLRGGRGARGVVRRGLAAGYRWHRRQLRRDPVLAAWVVQTNYRGAAGVIPPLRVDSHGPSDGRHGGEW